MPLYHDTELHQDADRRDLHRKMDNLERSEKACRNHDLLGWGLLLLAAFLVAFFAVRA